MSKPLCYAPFIGLYATGYADYAPCCVSEKSQHSMPAEQYWTSDEMRDIRSKLLNGEWPSSCNYCERKHIKGLRNDTVHWDNLYERDTLTINVDTGNSTNRPLYLDYRPSNICNLKCRMCVPNASSKIEEEINANPHLGKWRKAHNRQLQYIDELTEYLSTTELKQIKILGGEPTLDENVIALLENIIDNSIVLPELRFTTNGTNLNARFKRIMQQFTDIHVCYSVDGTDDTYNYIRTNANWTKTKKQIEENYRTTLQHARHSGFNVVLMPYSMYNLTSLLDWFYELYTQGYEFYVNFDDSDIYYTSMSAILPADMNQFIDAVRDWIDTADPLFVKRIDGIDRLLPLLQSVEHNSDHYTAFIKYNNELDAVRGTQLINLDKRFEKYT